MVKYTYSYLLSILLYSTIIFAADYNTLYLMEFENSSSDYRTDYLRKFFPELVKEKYSDRDFEIGYAPNLLANNDLKTNTLKDGILLYGKYSSSYTNVIISFEAYDVKTWEEKAARSYRCDMNDIECIEKAFLVCVDEEVMPLFCNQYDCLGVCDGTMLLDCMGNCGGDAILDCNDECNGLSYINECGECVQEESNLCTRDCNQDWGGEAFFNECNICVGGYSGLDVQYGKDCFGVCSGSAKLDCSNVCNGNSKVDCNGDCDGLAFFNDCNVCVGGNTKNDVGLGKDCNDICFGGAKFDLCGICDGNNESCSDCFGLPYGNAYKDMCGTCDSDPLNDCEQDCNGDWGGGAYINECLVCVGGNSGIDLNAGIDCRGVCWGLSKIDECGVCNGLGSIYECGCYSIEDGKCDCEGNIVDCSGECGGDITLDECGICNGDGSSCKKKEKKITKRTSTDISLYPILEKISLNKNDINKVPCQDCISNPEVNIVGELFDNNNQDIKQNNTNRFLYVVDELFKNAYNIFIKDMEVERLNDKNMVRISIPVEYSVKKDLFETLLSDLTFNTKTNDNGTFIIDVLQDDIYLSEDLKKYFSMMHYQIVPVIFFSNNDNNIKHIHIDSWTDRYNFFPFEINNDIDITLSSQFKPSFSITPSENSIQFNFDIKSQVSTYEFLFDLDEFNESNYSKFSLQFFYENDLEGNINSYAVKQ